MAPAYKLTYFNGRARGEVIRWILQYAGQDFEDNRVDFGDWPAIKATTPFGQIPVLDVDGKQLAQSTAIARFLARKHGVAGQNAWEEAQADALVDYVANDASKGWFLWLEAVVHGEEKKADSAKEEFISTTVVPFLQTLERHLQSNDGGKGYFVGSKPTWADFAVAYFLDEVVALDSSALDKYPLLKAHNTRVHDLKGIKEWLAKRPNTPF